METSKTINCILLSPKDNVAVVCEEANVGDRIELDGTTLIVKERILVGHKIALQKLKKGENIQKYAAPIGHASHVYNMKSNYLHSHTSREGT